MAVAGALRLPPGAAASLKIMVGGLSKQIYLPNMLAQQLGYFKEQNLNVTLIDEGSGQGSETEVVAGNVDHLLRDQITSQGCQFRSRFSSLRFLYEPSDPVDLIAELAF